MSMPYAMPMNDKYPESPPTILCSWLPPPPDALPLPAMDAAACRRPNDPPSIIAKSSHNIDTEKAPNFSIRHVEVTIIRYQLIIDN
jgi:hypothetical protein